MLKRYEVLNKLSTIRTLLFEIEDSELLGFSEAEMLLLSELLDTAPLKISQIMEGR